MYYPIDTASDKAHLRPCTLVVDLPSKRVEFVSERPLDTETNLNDLIWIGENGLRLRYGKQPYEYFLRSGEVWKLSDEKTVQGATTSSAVSEIAFEPHESFNEPPVLKALDRSTHKSKVFFDPNPQLSQIEMGNARIFKWKDKTGRELTGGLVAPNDYKAGKRYPLVLQSYGFVPGEFFADGRYKSAYPGRALASRGMFVLQLNDSRFENTMNPKGPVDARDAYLSAIEQLEKDGLVDSTKVGIMAFSHSGFYVFNMLTHEPKSVRAAVMAECTDATFTEYLNGVDWASPSFLKGMVEHLGSEPFGAGLENWVHESPGFNTDKIQAATLFQYYTPENLAWSWSVYPAMRAQGKPVEILYIRNGNHELVQPKQRFASQETSLDWFDFFLDDHEDPDPAKADQYARWRKLPKPKL